MTEKELVLEGKDAKEFLENLSRELTIEEKKELDEAEALYKKHCRL